ncbi:MAG: hypothetical protein JNG83_00370 [Opitutaceae bacterium]|nr:hypothetical protein [Opitutaceae bacterium]
MPDQPPLYFSDLSRCAPAAALTRERARGRWSLVDYETEDGVAGTMAFAYPNEGAPPVTLTVEARGRYRVYAGINYSRVPGGDHLHHSPWPIYGQVQLKFDDDVGYTRFALEAGWKVDSGWKLKTGMEGHGGGSRIGKSMQIYTSIQETFWCVREFAGPTRITVAGMEPPYSDEAGARLANLAYIKLVPVADAEGALWRRLQPQPDTRNLALVWCAGMLTGHAIGSRTFHPTSRDWFRDEIAPFLHNDVGTLMFECIRGSLSAYRSRINDVGEDGNRWDPSWVDPLACFRDLAREHGLRIFAALRMMGRGLPMVDAPIGRGRFIREHPEWARRDRDGTLTNNVSLAFPEVRQHWLDLLRETLEYGIDGVMIYFHRGQPFALFEQPVVDAFRREYGEDARQLPLDDPRLLRLWASYVTQFLRDVRALVDEKPGRQLAVSVYGMPYKFDQVQQFDPIRYNCDVDTWLREGLVDILMPTPTVEAGLIQRWRAQARPGLRIWPDLQPRVMPGDMSVPMARELYAAGADGFSLWDGERRPPHASHWAVMSRLGHRAELDALEKLATGLHRRVPLKKLAGHAVAFSYKDG